MIQMIATNELNALAYSMLSRDDIADLRATRDADELADLLINFAPDELISFPPLDDAIMNDDDDTASTIIEELRPILVAMILNPID